MPQEYRTEQEWAELMAQPSGSPGLQTDFGLGGSAATAAPAGASTPQTATAPHENLPSNAGASGTAAPGAPVSFAGSQKPVAQEFNLHSYTSRESPYSDLFTPISKGLGEAYQGLEKEAGGFSEAAGEHRTFESAGGPAAFETAFRPEASEAQKGQAKSLIQAKYEGPSGFSPDDLSYLQNQLKGLQDQGRSLTSVGGVRDLVRQRTPGLTGGELSFEAKGLLEDPLYRQAAQGLQEDIGGYEAALSGAGQVAQDYARARGGEEEAIAAKSKAIPQGKLDQLDALLGQRVTDQSAEEAALEQMYQDFLSTGDIGKLSGFKEGAGDVAAIQGDQDVQTKARAEAKQAELDAQFADLKDIPFMTPQVTSHGRGVVSLPDEWYQANKGKYSKDQMDALKARVLERQQAYEQAGFQPGIQSHAATDSGMNRLLGTEGPGEFSAYKPTYDFGAELDTMAPLPENLRSYVHREGGNTLSKESVASGEERFIYNRASELLDLAQRLEDAPAHERPQLKVEAKRYLDDLHGALEKRKGALSQGLLDFQLQVAAIRKKYNQAKSKKFLKKILSEVGMPGARDVMPKKFNQVMQPGLPGVF